MAETKEPLFAEAAALAAAPQAEPEEAVAEQTSIATDESVLTEEEKAAVEELMKAIDVSNTAQVMQYGTSAQQKIAEFSDETLERVRVKDMGTTSEALIDLMAELNHFNEQPKGFMGLFKKAGAKISQVKTKYEKVSVAVEKIVDQLEDHQIVLLKDIATMDELYKINLEYFKELTMYILAGKKKLQQLREVELPAAREKAEKSQLPEDAQAARDLEDQCTRFEKKIYDLELTRMVCIQTAPQIRLVQNSDATMNEKIQSTITNTIPLWKSQVILALGIAHTQQALEAQRAVTDTTNELLRQNADVLKTASVEVARESERGVVDMETLRHTNEQLISTIDEVMTIQKEGRQKRQEAEQELVKLEQELKQKLADI